MNLNDYQRLAARTECDQAKSLVRMQGYDASRLERFLPNDHPLHLPIRLNHSAIGLANEVGEICKQLQKWIYYGQEADIKNLVEEYGDCLWYIAEGLNALGVNMADVMQANIAKLKVRYPDKYTDYNAANRDKAAEEQALSMTGDTSYVKGQWNDPNTPPADMSGS